MAIFNRTLWAVIGLLCLAAGVAGLVGASGYLGGSVADYHLGSIALQSAKQPAAIMAGGVVVGGVIAALLGIILIGAEINFGPPTSFEDLHLPSGREAPGRTLIRSVALRRGLERDLEHIAGVQSVGVSLLGRPDAPRLQLRVEMESDRDLRKVEQAITRSMERFSTTLGAAVEGGDLLLRLRHPPRRTVA